MCRLILIFLTGFISLASSGYAATIWVNPAGTATFPYDTKITGFTDIKTAINNMQGGDELIITDGTYTGNENMISARLSTVNPVEIPSGTPEAWTTIRAENDFGVIIDGENIDFHQPFNQTVDYLYLRGIEFKRCGDMHEDQMSSPFFFQGCHYVKVIRCGASDAGMSLAIDESKNNMSNVIATNGGSSYMLFEECYSYGWGKYQFLILYSNHIVIRRCVARQDGWMYGVGDCFSSYNSQYVEWQNNIAVDMDQIRHYHPSGTDGLWGGFNLNSNGPPIQYNHWRGNVVRNMAIVGDVPLRYWKNGAWQQTGSNNNPGFRLTGADDTSFAENNLVIQAASGTITYDNSVFSHFTIIDSVYDDGMSVSGYGLYDANNTFRATVNDSIILGAEKAGAYNIWTDSDYNAYYDNPSNYWFAVTLPGPHDFSSENGTEVNLIWNETTNPTGALKYPHYIEPGSAMSGAASDGGDIGATIVYRYGADETLYGEPGYNTLTNVPLWPFPNEEIIRERMKAYTYWDEWDNLDPGNSSNPDTWVSGDRGFCVDGMTLTTYILEYLGNDWDGIDPPVDPPDPPDAILKHPWQWNFKS